MTNKILVLLLLGYSLPGISWASTLPPQTLPLLPTPHVQVTPARPLKFPNALGSHPQFPLEWWYVTGHLQSAEGSRLGFQLTFFRLRPPKVWANPSAFNPSQIYFAQAAISDPQIGHLLTAQQASTGSLGLGGASKDQTDVWLGHWRLQQRGSTYLAQVQGQQFSFQLQLQPTQPPLLEGPLGVSQKGPNPHNASYYYSIPQLRVRGNLQRDGRTVEVHGSAWLDHEWSKAYLPKNAVGWDWLGINLKDGGALMLFQMRNKEQQPLWLAGTWRHANGQVQYLHGSEIRWQALHHWRSPSTGIRYPIRWQIQIPGLRFVIQPLMQDQEFQAQESTGNTYWEGAVDIRERGKSLGSGYLELTGYGGQLQMGSGG